MQLSVIFIDPLAHSLPVGLDAGSRRSQLMGSSNVAEHPPGACRGSWSDVCASDHRVASAASASYGAMTFRLANGVDQVSSLWPVGRLVCRASSGSQMPFGLRNRIAVASVDDRSPEQSALAGLRRVHNAAPSWLYVGIRRRLEWRTTLGCEDHLRVRLIRGSSG
jgi:hypothetical protein